MIFVLMTSSNTWRMTDVTRLKKKVVWFIHRPRAGSLTHFFTVAYCMIKYYAQVFSNKHYDGDIWFLRKQNIKMHLKLWVILEFALHIIYVNFLVSIVSIRCFLCHQGEDLFRIIILRPFSVFRKILMLCFVDSKNW